MLLSALSFLVVAQSSSEIPEGLMNNPVFRHIVPIKVSLDCIANTLAGTPDNGKIMSKQVAC